MLAVLVGVAAFLPTRSSSAAGDLATGEHVFARYCQTCHGVRGDGRGPSAFRLEGPPPRDFTRGIYKFRTTPGGSVPMHEDIVRTVGEGVPGTTMPAWKRILKSRDIDSVALYIETLSPRFAANPNASRTAVHIPPAPAAPPTALELEAGRMLYIAFKCWECHGVRGAADGPASRTLHDDLNRPILPADFTRGVYRSGPRLEDLYRTIATGLEGAEPGSPVPTDPMPTYGLAVIVGREGLADLGEYASQLDPNTRSQVTSFIANLPTEERIASLSDPQRAYLGERRIWLLVGYIRSLVRPRRLLDFLVEDVQSQ
jgi:mono/diheme cytochrome c family protein